MRRILFALQLTLFTSFCVMAQVPQLRTDNIDEIIAAMTLEEKAQLLVGGGNDGFTGSGSMLGHQKKLVAGAAGITVAIPRLGIPATVMCDGPAGVHIDAHRDGSDRTFHATGFPIGSCLASTWNTALVDSVGQCIGNETLEYGCDAILGPGMNIHRNPLCGRNYEYYSEDPILTGAIGAAMVRGIQSQGVGVSPKHFAVNSQETDRVKVDAQLSERALREIYLRGFEKMVRTSHPWTMMSSYNKINGTFVQANRMLLTDILRSEWGFDGIVMTDWIGKRKDKPTHQEVSAGNDLMMPGYPAQVQDIIDAVNNGTLDIQDVNRNVRNMLQYIVRTPRFKGYRYSENPDLEAHATITRHVSTEGMVLLKNDGVLPLTGTKMVALFGVNSYDFLSGGLGSGCVFVPYVVDMVEGLRSNGITTTPELTDIYQKYVSYAKAKLHADKNPMMWFLDQGQPKLDEIDITERCINASIQQADAAIITIGRQAGEGMDRTVENDFNLSEQERINIDRISDLYHQAGKPVVVVINSGSVIETTSWRDRVDAILLAWQPGEEGGNSVADVLVGKANPSGRLTMTWPISVYDVPSTKNFPQDYDMYTYKAYGEWGTPIKDQDYTRYEEGLYVGYRYFDTFGKQVAYPFGYGLSYTTFQFGKPSVSQDKDGLNVKLKVTNTGRCPGKEVVQVYMTQVQGSRDKVQGTPAKELKGFAKTGELKAGESQMLTIHIPFADIPSWDENNHQWFPVGGTYNIMIGRNVSDIVYNVKGRIIQ